MASDGKTPVRYDPDEAGYDRKAGQNPEAFATASWTVKAGHAQMLKGEYRSSKHQLHDAVLLFVPA